MLGSPESHKVKETCSSLFISQEVEHIFVLSLSRQLAWLNGLSFSLCIILLQIKFSWKPNIIHTRLSAHYFYILSCSVYVSGGLINNNRLCRQWESAYLELCIYVLLLYFEAFFRSEVILFYTHGSLFPYINIGYEDFLFPLRILLWVSLIYSYAFA